MPDLPATISGMLMHILAAYFTFAQPALSARGYRKFIEMIEIGVVKRTAYYWQSIAFQWVWVIWILISLGLSGFSLWEIGLQAPMPGLGWFVLVILGALLAALAISALRARNLAVQNRVQKAFRPLEPILPHTRDERKVWVALSATAGICEEIAFRGFLLFYLAYLFPGVDVIWAVVISSVIFGLTHIYQGWKGVSIASFLGTGLAGLYVITGSLFPSMIIHALLDLRVLYIWRPEKNLSPVLLDETGGRGHSE